MKPISYAMLTEMTNVLIKILDNLILAIQAVFFISDIKS